MGGKKKEKEISHTFHGSLQNLLKAYRGKTMKEMVPMIMSILRWFLV